MSSNLYWRPRSAGEKLLSDELKHALHNLDQFNNRADGTYGDEMIPVLKGMEAAGVKDARKLIEAIEKYGEVELTERFRHDPTNTRRQHPIRLSRSRRRDKMSIDTERNTPEEMAEIHRQMEKRDTPPLQLDEVRRNLDEVLKQNGCMILPTHIGNEHLIAEAKAAIARLLIRERVEELERLHRFQGEGLPKRDYDNEADELIDDRLETLQAQIEDYGASSHP